nr:hypothetical protein Itr_chr05CG16810 [Ipomoea trifida]
MADLRTVGLLEIFLRSVLGNSQDLIILGVITLLRRPPKHFLRICEPDESRRERKRKACESSIQDKGAGKNNKLMSFYNKLVYGINSANLTKVANKLSR